MKRKIFSTLVALVLLLTLGLVTAVPASASVTSATVSVVPTTAGEADADYTITFNVGAVGALAPDDTITIVFLDDTAVADDTGLQDNIEGTVNAVEIVTVVGTSGTRTVVITVPATVNIANDGEATVVLTVGITNPTAAGDYTLTVATSIELTAVESQTYTIVDEAAAIADAEAALTASAAAKTAHLAAGGDALDTQYVAVEAAETTLNDELTAAPVVTADIVAATTALNDAVTALGDATPPAAITAGNAAITASGLAKAAHTDAGGAGATADAEYVAVVAAEVVLTAALDAVPKVTADIVAATTDLNDAVTTLEAATAAVLAAVTAGDAAIVASEAAKTAHTDAGGKATDAEYVAVEAAEDALNPALLEDPLVTADIVALTTALNDAVTALEAVTGALEAAITAGDAALVTSAAAKTAHTDAGGKATDAEYVAVEDAEVILTAALAAVPEVIGTITAATTALNDAVTALEAVTGALEAAITAGDAAIVASGLAKTAHLAAGGAGATADAEYVAVVDAEVILTAALAEDPLVTADIVAATTALDDAVDILEAATAAVLAADTAGGEALTVSGLAKTAHTDAGGNILDAEYVAVEDAEGVLTAALAEDPLVTADIVAATTDLNDAVTALAATAASAVTDAEAALAASAAAKTAHLAAGGDALDTQYVAVEAAETTLNDELTAAPVVTADIVAATTALNTAVTALEAVTDLWTTYDMLLTLNAGWTLISTDGWIDSETSAWEGTVTLKYRYTGVAFVEADFADLKPVEALYVKMPSGGWAGLNYLDASPGMSAKLLVEGWNLISSGTEADAGAVLSPLQDIGNQGTGLTTLVSQGSYNLTSDDWYIDASDWSNVTGNTMIPFDGYWIYMNAGKSFGVILQ